MTDPTALQMAFAVVATVAPIALVVRTLAWRVERDLPTRSDALPWPRGVQEEDPLPWRFEPTTR